MDTILSSFQSDHTSRDLPLSSLSSIGLDKSFVAMKSAQESSVLQALLQSCSELFRTLNKEQRLKACSDLLQQGFPQDLYGICNTLDINCIAFLTCKRVQENDEKFFGPIRLASRLGTHWAVRPDKLWAILVTDGSGMMWSSVRHGHNYLLTYKQGLKLYEESRPMSCRDYDKGAVVLWSGQVWTVLKREGTMYTIRSNKDFSVQRQVSLQDLEASVAPEAMSPAELANRTEEMKRVLSGIVKSYSTVDYDVQGLKTFADDTLKM